MDKKNFFLRNRPKSDLFWGHCLSSCLCFQLKKEMYSYETKIRVRYSETDKMGYVYYGNYPQYYEVGRVELMRSLGFSYRQLEDMGIMMPVLSMNIRYMRPGFYDDELTIKTTVRELPTSRIRFEYEVTNTEGKVLNNGETVLGFINEDTRRAIRPPKEIMESFMPYFGRS